jgi:demethylmenaquinone methyltransferase/2-methoxy-6-polyprenyl-1,4-benzoquinol methylase
MTDLENLVAATAAYYAARAAVYDETAGYTDLEAEQLRVPIKARYRDMFRGHAVLEIACGTGYWTRTIGEVADSLLATDINPSLIAKARDRCKGLSNVTFQIADAYTFSGVSTGFSAAFGIWWWSHVPLERLSIFLRALHSKLQPGALVLFVDQLPYAGHVRRHDPQGNTIELRSLPDGRSFQIVKNFPTEEGIRKALAGIADNVEYIERPDEKSWNVIYNVRTESLANSSSRGGRARG